MSCRLLKQILDICAATFYESSSTCLHSLRLVLCNFVAQQIDALSSQESHRDVMYSFHVEHLVRSIKTNNMLHSLEC